MGAGPRHAIIVLGARWPNGRELFFPDLRSGIFHRNFRPRSVSFRGRLPTQKMYMILVCVACTSAIEGVILQQPLTVTSINIDCGGCGGAIDFSKEVS